MEKIDETSVEKPDQGNAGQAANATHYVARSSLDEDYGIPWVVIEQAPWSAVQATGTGAAAELPKAMDGEKCVPLRKTACACSMGPLVSS